MENIKKHKVIVLVLALVLVVAMLGGVLVAIARDSEEGDNVVKSDEGATHSHDGEGEHSHDDEESESSEPDYTHQTDLEDVTKGATVRGTAFAGDASGVAKSLFVIESGYKMVAEFENLPDPVDDSFYEGWLVNPDDGMFFSTGKVKKDESGKYVDTFSSLADYTSSYTKYVLTFEPNDDDPAPAEHIVEGVMTAN